MGGLKRMRTQVFHPSDNRPDILNTVIIITDEYQFPPKPLLLQEEINAVNESGIRTLLVGITKRIDVDTIVSLASPPQKVCCKRIYLSHNTCRIT